jgi:hypothetical protein
MLLNQLQAAFGTVSTVLSVGTFFLSHTLALHRPKNGAATTNANDTAKAMRIYISFLPGGSFSTGSKPPHQLLTTTSQHGIHHSNCD